MSEKLSSNDSAESQSARDTSLIEELCGKLDEVLALARELHVAVGPTKLRAVLTVDEVADLLLVDRKSAYSAIQRGEIPGVVRIGRAIRISHDVFVRWLHQSQLDSADLASSTITCNCASPKKSERHPKRPRTRHHEQEK